MLNRSILIVFILFFSSASVASAKILNFAPRCRTFFGLKLQFDKMDIKSWDIVESKSEGPFDRLHRHENVISGEGRTATTLEKLLPKHVREDLGKFDDRSSVDVVLDFYFPGNSKLPDSSPRKKQIESFLESSFRTVNDGRPLEPGDIQVFRYKGEIVHAIIFLGVGTSYQKPDLSLPVGFYSYGQVQFSLMRGKQASDFSFENYQSQL